MKWFKEEHNGAQKDDFKKGWVETNVFPTGGINKHTEFILNRIEPFVREMLNKNNVETFHCLLEKEELRFRLYGNEEQIKPLIQKWLEQLKMENLIEDRSGLNPRYKGEEKAAGKLGQQAYYAYMKAGCEIAFAMRGKRFEKPTNFYHCRGFHFILNSCGFGITDEINLYIKKVLPERIQTYSQLLPEDFKRNKPVLLKMITELQKIVSNM